MDNIPKKYQRVLLYLRQLISFRADFCLATESEASVSSNDYLEMQSFRNPIVLLPAANYVYYSMVRVGANRQANCDTLMRF